jgi:hypothetical protein
MTITKKLAEARLHYISWNGSILSSIMLIQHSFEKLAEDDFIKKYKESLLKFLVDTSNVIKNNEVDEMTFFNCSTLYNIVQNTEWAIVELLKIILTEYPCKLPESNISFKSLLKTSKNEIINKAIEEYIIKILYKRPEEYINIVIQILSLDSINIDVVTKYSEMKARRDLGMHNNWLTNELYLEKSHKIYYDNINVSAIPDGKYITEIYDISNNLIEELFIKAEKKFA